MYSIRKHEWISDKLLIGELNGSMAFKVQIMHLNIHHCHPEKSALLSYAFDQTKVYLHLLFIVYKILSHPLSACALAGASDCSILREFVNSLNDCDAMIIMVLFNEITAQTSISIICIAENKMQNQSCYLLIIGKFLNQ
ncbi:hypothetical protein GQX74_004467 [Glossina fuscipes]|nr:hypothetical protein GQX74_004467 [Glossina fuscipes]